MTVHLVYETHSVTEDNEAGIATGWLPGRLSEQGRVLAVELGQRRPADGFAAVWSSDLARAVETAELAYAGSGVPLHVDSRLRECDHGTHRSSGSPAGSGRSPETGGTAYALVVGTPPERQ